MISLDKWIKWIIGVIMMFGIVYVQIHILSIEVIPANKGMWPALVCFVYMPFLLLTYFNDDFRQGVGNFIRNLVPPISLNFKSQPTKVKDRGALDD